MLLQVFQSVLRGSEGVEWGDYPIGVPVMSSIYPPDKDQLDGSERFLFQGAQVSQSPSVIDFWRWCCSDLQDNVTRGILAEFVVASALNIKLGVRESWADFDLVTEDGIRVEVKSSGRLQSWEQKKLSPSEFGQLKSKKWKPLVGYTGEPTFGGDVYVFCVQTAVTHEDYDPFELSQWTFYVAGRKTMESLDQKKTTLAALTRIGLQEVSFDGLDQAVKYTWNQRDDDC